MHGPDQQTAVITRLIEQRWMRSRNLYPSILDARSEILLSTSTMGIIALLPRHAEQFVYRWKSVRNGAWSIKALVHIDITYGRPQMRRDARTDANHAEIRMALRAAGYSCYDLFRLGQGWPDILVLSKTGIPILGEIKSDEGRL